MSLFNQKWIGFDGKSITGKTPSRLVIHAAPGVELSQAQYGAVVHAYKLFADAMAVSPHAGMYFSQDRKLPDGMRVRMTSNNGVDVVDVWPDGSGGTQVHCPDYYSGVINQGWNIVAENGNTFLLSFYPSEKFAGDEPRAWKLLPKYPSMTEATLQNGDLKVMVRRSFSSGLHRGPSSCATRPRMGSPRSLNCRH